MLEVLKKRFEDNPQRHPGIRWQTVEERLSAQALEVLKRMEETGGEPDVTGIEENTGRVVFCDCSKETPAKRRSVCYDEQALRNRKKNPPADSAMRQAEQMGCSLVTEDLYRKLQETGEYDQKTSSWIATPETIRNLGGALFAERRYGTVFIFHNGADSYYGVRGWRGVLFI
ncbi:MAG: DUF4256 domain-containing protein [Solobacterium sp.]|nr:DUF4256 domain-containing protein [Solobacterium sp.]